MYAIDRVHAYIYVCMYVTGVWESVLYLHPICNFEEA